jgi:clan AA aspartic protease
VSTFAVPAILSNPERAERAVTVDLLVDTGATYTLLPADIVATLELATPYEQAAVLASGEQISYRVGEVRFRLGEEERVTVFWLGPRGSRGLLGAVTLEQFGLAADPVNRRLVRVPGLLV